MTANRHPKKSELRRLKKLAAEAKPAYEPDDGPLTAKQIKAIKKLVPQGRGMLVTSSLFKEMNGGAEMIPQGASRKPRLKSATRRGPSRNQYP